MPKLDLGSATRIKGALGDIAALKGPGFDWKAQPAASGGMITDITDPVDGLTYRVATFTLGGTLEVTRAGEFEYLILGGGASGSANSNGRAGQPGGASGVARQGTITLSAASYAIAVGAGGAGVTNSDASGIDGNAGSASSALGITAAGGGLLQQTPLMTGRACRAARMLIFPVVQVLRGRILLVGALAQQGLAKMQQMPPPATAATALKARSPAWPHSTAAVVVRRANGLPPRQV